MARLLSISLFSLLALLSGSAATERPVLARVRMQSEPCKKMGVATIMSVDAAVPQVRMRGAALLPAASSQSS